jgi:hypothetical protein
MITLAMQRTEIERRGGGISSSGQRCLIVRSGYETGVNAGLGGLGITQGFIFESD